MLYTVTHTFQGSLCGVWVSGDIKISLYEIETRSSAAFRSVSKIKHHWSKKKETKKTRKINIAVLKLK